MGVMLFMLQPFPKILFNLYHARKKFNRREILLDSSKEIK